MGRGPSLEADSRSANQIADVVREPEGLLLGSHVPATDHCPATLNQINPVHNLTTCLV
jgi:hypothetical protein